MDIQFLTNPVWEKELTEAVELLKDLEKMLCIDDITEDTLTEFCWLNHNDIWGYCCHEDVSNADCENYIYFHPKCLKEVPF